AASSQKAEPVPNPEPQLEPEPEPELSFRPASEFIDQAESSSGRSSGKLLDPGPGSRDELPPASAGPVLDTALGTATPTRTREPAAEPVRPDRKPASTGRNEERTLPRIPLSESRLVPAERANTVTSGSPRQHTAGGSEKPARLL